MQNDTNAANVELDLLGTRDGLLLAASFAKSWTLNRFGFPSIVGIACFWFPSLS